MSGVEICRYMDAPSAREDRQEALQGIANYISDNIGPNDRVILPLSGGVDSSTVLEICKLANVSDKVFPVLLEHGYLRKGEFKSVCDKFSGYKNFQGRDVKHFFYVPTFGVDDAEEKRNRFKRAYFTTFRKIKQELGCNVLIDGTIRPDIEETEDGIKGQHNVGIEEKYGVAKVIQPLANQAKPDVRILAEMLGIDHLRPPFPGPGDMLRTPGAINLERLEVGKEVDYMVETAIAKYYEKKQGAKMVIGPNGEQTPFQYFAATFIHKTPGDEFEIAFSDFAKISSTYGYLAALGIKEDDIRLLGTKVTGKTPDNKRIYKDAICIGRRNIEPEQWPEVAKIAETDLEISRVLLNLGFNGHGGDYNYDVVIRAVDSTDARTAKVSEVEPEFLTGLAERIIRECENIGDVFFDITPKPPATIEYE